LDFLGDGSSSEGRKTPILTPRKGILKSPKVTDEKIFIYSIVSLTTLGFYSKRK